MDYSDIVDIQISYVRYVCGGWFISLAAEIGKLKYIINLIIYYTIIL